LADFNRGIPARPLMAGFLLSLADEIELPRSRYPVTL
jgi:hypothetical protein